MGIPLIVSKSYYNATVSSRSIGLCTRVFQDERVCLFIQIRFHRENV